MGNDEIKKTTDKLITDINKAAKELESVQKECLHKEYDVTTPSEGGTPKRVCKLCKRDLGYADKDEIEKYLNGGRI